MNKRTSFKLVEADSEKDLERIPFELVKKNYEGDYGGKLIREKGHAYSKKHDITISVNSGMVDSNNIERLTRKVSNDTGKPFSNVLKNLIKKPDYYPLRLANVLVAIFTAGLIFFGLERLNVTGFVLSNISNSTAIPIGYISNNTANIGIIICALGIIGLLVWKWRK
ncbi:MAG: hypothetical protein KKF67_02395 [Nanoarchaeota archaeon]|nr:hypothetical protein [Nanoarchaeota archaeon]